MELLEYLAQKQFGRKAARALCGLPGIFEHDRVYQRRDIVEILRRRFKELGGTSGPDEVATAIKQWLPKPDSPFRKVDSGLYRFIGAGGGAESLDKAPQPTTTISRTLSDETTLETLEPGREFGSGPCEVYAWCLPRYQGIGLDRWPVKIGWASEEGFSGYARDFWENLPEPPRYLLRFKCESEPAAQDVESLLQRLFRVRGQEVPDWRGKGWFLTNPDEVEEAIRMLTRSA